MLESQLLKVNYNRIVFVTGKAYCSKCIYKERNDCPADICKGGHFEKKFK